jgi:hypothetical protein
MAGAAGRNARTPLKPRLNPELPLATSAFRTARDAASERDPVGLDRQQQEPRREVGVLIKPA